MNDFLSSFLNKISKKVSRRKTIKMGMRKRFSWLLEVAYRPSKEPFLEYPHQTERQGGVRVVLFI